MREPRPTVVPAPSFNVPLGLLAIAGLSGYEGATPLAALAGLLGVFLSVQATRVKFVFDDEALEVVIAGKEEEQTENRFVGGRNRWTYDSFVNWVRALAPLSGQPTTKPHLATAVLPPASLPPRALYFTTAFTTATNTPHRRHRRRAHRITSHDIRSSGGPASRCSSTSRRRRRAPRARSTSSRVRRPRVLGVGRGGVQVERGESASPRQCRT